MISPAWPSSGSFGRFLAPVPDPDIADCPRAAPGPPRRGRRQPAGRADGVPGFWRIIQDEERHRLRRDLHDGLGPLLAAITMRIDAARVLLAADPAEADAVLACAYDDAQSAIADMRRLAFDMRPCVLDGVGLFPALRLQAARFEEASGGRLRVRVETPVRMRALPAAIELAVYCIVSEALTNIARHAQARTCTIQLTTHPGDTGKVRGEVQLEITDDGVGLPARPRNGIGLASMRDRACEFGGEFRVDRIEPHGTRLWARLAVDTREHTS